jgi:uncharacterized membrane protein
MSNERRRPANTIASLFGNERRLKPAGRAWPLVVVVAGLGLALRAISLDEEVLSLDEASTWRVASRDLSSLFMHCAFNVHPPAYFLLLKVWMHAFGDSPTAMRSLSAIIGTLSVAVVYFLVRELSIHSPLLGTPSGCRTAVFPAQQRPIGALAAALLLAVCPLQVELGRTARMYSLAILLTATSSWLLVRARRAAERDAWAWWTGYGLSVSLLCYTHNYGIFTAIAQGVFLAADVFLARSISLARALRVGISGSGALGLAFCLYSPWTGVIWAQSAEVQAGYWIPPITGIRAREMVHPTNAYLLSWMA